MHDVTDILRELKHRGRRIIGCLPLYPPLELLHSFGLIPVVLWGLRSAVKTFTLSDRHLQNYACQPARSLTEFILAEGGNLFDGLFMYNACDTLRNLPEIIEAGLDGSGERLPMFRLHVPAVPEDRTGAMEYLKKRVEILTRELELFTQKAFSPDSFLASTRLYGRHRELCVQAEDLAVTGKLSFTACAALLARAHHTAVEDHIAELQRALSEAGETPEVDAVHARVMISGIQAPPSELIEVMENKGLRVVANDTATLSRSYGHVPPPCADPGEYYCDFYFHHGPCTTMLWAGDRRIEAIRDRMARTGAHGFIFFGEKFCEYEYFEIPHLTDLLHASGIDTLFLELGADDMTNLMPVRTRIEAFAEMLHNKIKP
jgi:benzoyl-CoA reductase/2-hydroxyglutaryl-CoA dehydratase subunit BcrC/BadD/HgdB